MAQLTHFVVVDAEDTTAPEKFPSLDEGDQVQSFQSTPGPSDNPFFVHGLQYTPEEEAAVIRILDTRLFPWILLTTFVLNMDRTNNSNAISDNLPADLGFNINVVNLATAIYSVIFSIFCLSGAVIAKRIPPSRCNTQRLRSAMSYAESDTRDTHSHVFLGIGNACTCPHQKQGWIHYR